MILLSFYTSKNFMLLTRIYIYTYIRREILTVHLKMTKVWSKRRVVPFIFFVEITLGGDKNKEFAEKEAWKIHASSEQL